VSSSLQKVGVSCAFVGRFLLFLLMAAFVGAACSVSPQGSVKGTTQALEPGESLLQSTVEFRSDGFVTDRSMTSGATIVSGQTYTLSPAGRATREDRAGALPSEQHYRTDPLGRLACVVSDSGTSCPSTTRLLPGTGKGHAPPTRRRAVGKDPRALTLVGARGFEPPTSCSQMRRRVAGRGRWA
jgi:hypothetical protein